MSVKIEVTKARVKILKFSESFFSAIKCLIFKVEYRC